MKTTKYRAGLIGCSMAVLLTGCGMVPYKAYTNTELRPGAPDSTQASFVLRDTRTVQTPAGQIDCNPKKHKDVLVMLALSGGGSRAALMSGLAMLELQDIKIRDSDILSEVDLISSVSGGSLAAAYYASSGDPNPQDSKNECGRSYSGRVWDRTTVPDLMAKDYLWRWIGNWFWPDNIMLYWFSTYDRTDMMAQTFADNLYDTKDFGFDIDFSGLNPKRPNLILNATQGSRSPDGNSTFGQPFTFTSDDFEKRVCSPINDYNLARGVMASATFPGVFNFMTLRNYCERGREEKQYVHVFDGGNSDNLGLTSLKRSIWMIGPERLAQYRKVIVILVDAFTEGGGVSPSLNDPRHWYDFVVDTNFITATDSLLAKNRDDLLNQFETGDIFPYSPKELAGIKDIALSARKQKEVTTACKKFFSWEPPDQAAVDCSSSKLDMMNDLVKKKLLFVQINFQKVADENLRNQLNNIATNFVFSSKKNSTTHLSDEMAIQCAVPVLVGTGEKTGCDGRYRMSPSVQTEWKKVMQSFDATP